MHLSRFKPGANDDIEDCLIEQEIRQDLENLTVDDFIDALADTIDKDTTGDMILQNLEEAYHRIRLYKNERIYELLFMKRSKIFRFFKENYSKIQTSYD